MKTIRAKFLPFLTLLLAGCAGWAGHGVTLAPPRKLRVAVLPVSEAVRIRKLEHIMTVPPGAALPADEAAAVEAQLGEVRRQLTAALEARLGAEGLFEVVPDSDVAAALEEAGSCATVCEPTPAQARLLGARLLADAVLASRLSGYGRVKKKWITLMMAAGLVEGGVQGVVAAKLVHNTWVAIGVAAEEVAQEAVTWWGGAFLFGKAFSPVILEGELRGTADGAVLWSKTAFATLDKKELLGYPESLRGSKELRLRLTAGHAVDGLVLSLRKKTLKNLR